LNKNPICKGMGGGTETCTGRGGQSKPGESKKREKIDITQRGEYNERGRKNKGLPSGGALKDPGRGNTQGGKEKASGRKKGGRGG